MVVALLATACQQVEVTTYDGTRSTNLAQHYLTRDRGDGYTLSSSPGAARITAPSTNTGTETRSVFWPPSTPMAVDQQSCATWTDQVGDQVQQGVALRVRNDDGRWRAVTVLKNIYWGQVWQFNVHTWDSTRSPTQQVHGNVKLESVFREGDTYQGKPLPWKVCARARGDLVTLKAWRGDEAEPAWGDATHGGSVRLPAGWAYAGKAGWYAGHVPARGTAGFADLRTSNWETRPDPQA